MLTNCLTACAHLTITVSKIEWDIGRKSSYFHTPLHSTPPLGEFPSECRHPVWYGKTFKDMFIRFAMIHERDGRTDGQTPHHSIYRAYAYASRGKNNRCKYLSVFHKIPGPRIIRWYKQIAAKLLSLSINQSEKNQSDQSNDCYCETTITVLINKGCMQ